MIFLGLNIEIEYLSFCNIIKSQLVCLVLFLVYFWKFFLGPTRASNTLAGEAVPLSQHTPPPSCLTFGGPTGPLGSLSSLAGPLSIFSKLVPLSSVDPTSFSLQTLSHFSVCRQDHSAYFDPLYLFSGLN